MDELTRARALTTTKLAFELLRSVYLDLANAVVSAEGDTGALLLSDNEKRAALVFAVIGAEHPRTRQEPRSSKQPYGRWALSCTKLRAPI